METTSRSRMLQLERITDIERLEALTPEWDALAALQRPRVPFSTPLWNLLWWRYFREQRRWLQDELSAYVIRNEHGAVIAIAPLMLSCRPSFGPLRVRTLQFFGADRNLTEIRAVVCDPGRTAEVLTALHARLNGDAKLWDRMQWCGIPDHLARPQFKTDGDWRWSSSSPMYVLRLAETWDELKSRLSRNAKESLRHGYNSLSRDGHVFEFRIIDRTDAVPEALHRFFALHAERARAKGTVVHPNAFAAAREREFLAAVIHAMAERQQLRIFELRIGGTVVACRIGFVLQDELYLYYSGYSMGWAKYGVMTTLLAESLRWAIEHGVTAVNLSTGDDRSKTRWRPERLDFSQAVQHSRAWHGRLMSPAYEWFVQACHGFGLQSPLSSIRRAAGDRI